MFGMPLGPAIGVLLAGLFFGHFGLTVGHEVGTFGFALFIFSVGIQAGPSFFSAFLEDGPKYIILAIVVAVISFFLAWGLAQLFEFENGFDAGLLAGALTSTPTLAGAQDAIRSGLAVIPEGMDSKNLLKNVGVGYAITYIIGAVMTIVLVRYVPQILHLNLQAMASTYAKEKGLIRSHEKRETTGDTLPIIRAYRVREEAVGKTISQRKAELNYPGAVLKIRRGHELLPPDSDLVLMKGDKISIIASLKIHKIAQQEIGAEVLDTELLDYRIRAHDIVVINSHIVGKTIKELDFPRQNGCWADSLVRAGIALPITEEVVMQKGDQLHLVGEEGRLRKLAEEIGYIEEEMEETDLVTFSFGIAAGILIGLVVFKAGNVNIGLGTAGGLLIMGIIIGYLTSLKPTFGRVPSAARYLLKELGLMLLMASIGLNAGEGIVEGLQTVGPVIALCAIIVTTIPLVVGYAAGRKILKLNPVLLLGSLSGAMTNTPALGVITAEAKSSVPAIGYAGTYTFANVLLTFAGSYIMMI